jgi:hypothetical protein
MTEKLTVPVCFLVTPSMYEGIRKAANRREIKVAQLIRPLIRQFLESESRSENKLTENLNQEKGELYEDTSSI